MYKTTDNFLRMFGYSNLDELPKLPRYKVDENNQIVIDELALNDMDIEAINKKENEQITIEEVEQANNIEGSQLHEQK